MTGHDAILWQSARNLLDAQENLNKLFESFRQVECSDTGLQIEELDQDGSDFAEWLKGVDRKVFDAVEEFIPTCIDAQGNLVNAWSDLENNLANFDTDQLMA